MTKVSSDPVANGVYTEFNLNDYVWVKLTDAGRVAHRNHWERLSFGTVHDYKPVDEIDGWSRWQLWELMQVFGGSLYNGCNVPFETTIRMED